MNAIAITTGIPVNILMGVATAATASEQDRTNWAVRIEERRKVYRALLRQGEPPAGWVTGQAALWGLGHATVSAELAAAREALAPRRPRAPLPCR